MLEALCRQSSTTLDIVHAEDGPPITQRTSGLEQTRDSLIAPFCSLCQAHIPSDAVPLKMWNSEARACSYVMIQRARIHRPRARRLNGHQAG
jgi:hypothetical protein